MRRKRSITWLDVRNGRVVKGVRFENLTDEGDPVELAARYSAEGADEICFLDISATLEGRTTMLDIVRRTAEKISIPLSVGGGIDSVDTMKAALRAGADKVAINSAAVANPALITECAEVFGRQCVVVSIDAMRTDTGWVVRTHGGSREVPLDAVEWAAECERRGAGELLITAIDRDGTYSGFDLELLAAIRERTTIPVIASGGAGTARHFVEVLQADLSDAALAASIFHRGEIAISEVKDELAAAGVPVRTTV